MHAIVAAAITATATADIIAIKLISNNSNSTIITTISLIILIFQHITKQINLINLDVLQEHLFHSISHQ